MGLWREQVVPRMTERSLRGSAYDGLRQEVCAPLSGAVLEIGFGSGLNLRWYPPDVTSVTAVEPSDVGWRLSGGRRQRTGVPVERGGLDGQRLEAADATYDAALSTFTLCSIPDVTAALNEVRRVLRPGGVLAVLEHGLAPDARVAAWQRRLEPLQKRVAAGCHLTRDVADLVAGAGFEITKLRTDYLEGPAVARPWIYGYQLVARRP